MYPIADNVLIYPSSNGAGKPESRVNTEGNVSGILRQAVTRNCVVTDFQIDTDWRGQPWSTSTLRILSGECVINGYQISIKQTCTLSGANGDTIDGSTGSTVYLVMQLQFVSGLLAPNTSDGSGTPIANAIRLYLTTTKPVDDNSLVIASATYGAAAQVLVGDFIAGDKTRLSTEDIYSDISGSGEKNLETRLNEIDASQEALRENTVFRDGSQTVYGTLTFTSSASESSSGIKVGHDYIQHTEYRVPLSVYIANTSQNKVLRYTPVVIKRSTPAGSTSIMNITTVGSTMQSLNSKFVGFIAEDTAYTFSSPRFVSIPVITHGLLNKAIPVASCVYGPVSSLTDVAPVDGYDDVTRFIGSDIYLNTFESDTGKGYLWNLYPINSSELSISVSQPNTGSIGYITGVSDDGYFSIYLY